MKPHGFVLDFVGIFDKLEKALAFDSDEVNAIVKNLDLLKGLLREKKMEQHPPGWCRRALRADKKVRLISKRKKVLMVRLTLFIAPCWMLKSQTRRM